MVHYECDRIFLIVLEAVLPTVERNTVIRSAKWRITQKREGEGRALGFGSGASRSCFN